MRNFLLCSFYLLILLVVSGTDPAFAQTETPEPTDIPPTPTSTFVPLFSPVEDIEIDYSCPGSQPEGWGSITPSAWWYMNCARCVTPQPPAEDWDWGSNPLVPTDINPTITPTPVVTSKEAEVYFEWSNDPPAEYIEPNTMHISSTINTYYNYLTTSYYRIYEEVTTGPYKDIVIYGNFYGAYYFEGMGSLYSYYNSGVMVQGSCVSIQGCIVEHNGITTTLTNGQNYTFWTETVSLVNDEVLITDDIDFKVTIKKTTETTMKQGFIITVSKLNNYMWSDSSWYNDFIWDYEPINNDPIPQDTFCSNVEPGGDYGVGGPDDLFSLPILATGEGTCLSFFPVTIPLSWLEFVWEQAQDFDLPAWNLCFKPLTFGELKLFGMTINMDLIAYAMAGIALIRILTRS